MAKNVLRLNVFALAERPSGLNQRFPSFHITDVGHRVADLK
jgi:hypothetical protein